MTHWLGFSEADFDASRAPRGTSKRAAATAGQPALFFTPTPVTRPKRAPGQDQLPGQVSIFDTDATDTEE